MLERLLKKASALVFKHYRLISCLFAFFTIASIYSVFHMEIKTDIIDVLPAGNPAVAQFKDFVQKYNVLDSVTVVISSDSRTVYEHADLIESLAGKLKMSPLVKHVEYASFGGGNEFFLHNFPLFLDERGLRQLSERLAPAGIQRQIKINYQNLVSPVGSPADSELIYRDPLDLRGIIAESMRRRHPDNPFDLSFGYYITKDHSAALIFVKPSGGSRDMAFVKKLRPELDSIIRSALAESGSPQGISVQLTGGYLLSDEVRQVIRHDIISSTLLSAVLIALIIWLAYRVRPVVLGIVACTMVASLSMTLAVAYLIFGSLNIVTSIVCGLLIGMYVDYCILTLKRYGDEMLLKNDRRAALETTMTKAGAVMVMSAVTTSISFFSIIVTRFDGLYELGIVSGLGVLICFFTTFFLMNSLMIWVSAGGADRILSIRVPTSGVDRLAMLIEKRPRRIVQICILLIALLILGMKDLRFDNNPEHIGFRGSRVVAVMKSLSRKLHSSGEPIQVFIKANSMDGLSASFDRLDKRLMQWKSERLIARADSLSGFLPPPYLQNTAIHTMERLSLSNPAGMERVEPLVVRELDKNGMKYDPGRLKTYLTLVLNAMHRSAIVGLNNLDGIGDSYIKRFFNKEDMSMVAYLYPVTGSWDKGAIERIRENVAEEGPGWALVGGPILYSEIKTSILRGSALAVFITLGLNILFVALFLKRSIFVILAMLPVCLGFMLTLSIMGWLGAPFNFINIGTMALIFGFGVDYGLYIMQAYLREETRDINNALRLSGKNVTMCAATTVAGCGSLITADFSGIASVGLVLTIGAVCCSAITLIFLPSLLWLQKKGSNGKV